MLKYVFICKNMNFRGLFIIFSVTQLIFYHLKLIFKKNYCYYFLLIIIREYLVE